MSAGRTTAERLARLTAELNDDSFQVRERATRELAATPLPAELGEEVRASLRRLGEKP